MSTNPAVDTLVRPLPLEAIDESPTNPRRHFDDASLKDLAADILVHGVLQPVLVRPKKGNRYELVFGARRFRASKLAKVTTIPAMVRELDDIRTLEMQIVENAKRADIHPLEEADAYRRLHIDHKLTVDQIVERTGKSKAYVYARMKLCALVDEKAREAFFAGELEASVALLISRMDPKLQAKATKRVLESDMSARQAQQDLLRQGYLLRVHKAPFDVGDASIVPEAGACTKCPKRVDPDGLVVIGQKVNDTDLCDDGACWQTKEDLHRAKKLAAVVSKGMKALSRTENAKLLNQWGELYLRGTGYVRPEDQLGQEVTGSYSSRTTWKEILGKVEKKGVKVQPIAALDGEGKVVTLALQKDITAAAKKAKVSLRKAPKKPTTSRSSPPKPKPLTDAQRAEMSLAEKERDLAESTAKNATDLAYKNIAAAVHGNPKAEAKILALLVDEVLEEAQYSLDSAGLLKRFGLANETRDAARLRAVLKLKPDQIRELAVYAYIGFKLERDIGPMMDDLIDPTDDKTEFPEVVHDVAELLDVDLVAIEKKVKADYKAAIADLRKPKPVQTSAKAPAAKKNAFEKIADKTRKSIAKSEKKPKAKK